MNIKMSGDLNLKGLEKALDDAVSSSLEEIGERAVDLIHEELTSGDRSGKFVKRDGRQHRASAPDEPPASWSGALAASLRYEVDPDGEAVAVYADAPYAGYLEHGTLTIAPRPFIGPVLERLPPEIDAILMRSFGKEGLGK